jgi:hypothetical protein
VKVAVEPKKKSVENFYIFQLVVVSLIFSTLIYLKSQLLSTRMSPRQSKPNFPPKPFLLLVQSRNLEKIKLPGGSDSTTESFIRLGPSEF